MFSMERSNGNSQMCLLRSRVSTQVDIQKVKKACGIYFRKADSNDVDYVRAMLAFTPSQTMECWINDCLSRSYLNSFLFTPLWHWK